MRIHSSNYGQKQFFDKNSVESLSESQGWYKVPGKSHLSSLRGKNYRVNEKMERYQRTWSGIILGIVCTVGSFGLAPLFSKKVKQLFSGRQVAKIIEPARASSLKESKAEKNRRQFFESLDKAIKKYPDNYTTLTGNAICIPSLIRQAYDESLSLDDFENKLQKLQKEGKLQSRAGFGSKIISYIVDMAKAPLLLEAKVHNPTDASRADIYEKAPIYPVKSALFATMADSGGAANVVDRIMQKNPYAKCGVMICANSGLPCGLVGANGYADRKTLNVKTQEESIIANMLLTRFGEDKGKHKEFIHSSFGGIWGMVDGAKGRSTMTHQGIDFTKTTNASDYNQVYTLNDCPLSAIAGPKGNKTLVPNKANLVTLVYADSVNANTIGSPEGTMMRTRNAKAAEDYDFFCECIKTKLRSSLDAMVAEGNTHAIIGRLSCGIYAPDKWKQDPTNINKDFNKILAEVLQERVGPNGETRREYFVDVIIPHVS